MFSIGAHVADGKQGDGFFKELCEDQLPSVILARQNGQPSLSRRMLSSPPTVT